MAKTLQAFSYWFKAFLGGILILCGFALPVISQSPGDLAVIGFNTDTQQEISFVAFANFEPGTKIFISTREWNGDTFTGEESEVTYTVPREGLAPGQVVSIDVGKRSSSNNGTVTVTEEFVFSGNREELYVYTGPDKDRPETFLYALTTKQAWDEDEISGTGLNEMAAMADFGAEYIPSFGMYQGPRTGSIKRIKSLIGKGSGQWLTGRLNENQDLNFDTSPFKFITPTVRFVSNTIQVDESAGTATFEVELFESSGREMEVEVRFDPSAGSTGSAEVGEFSPQKILFDENDSDGTTVTVNVNLIDDSNYEGTEFAVFQLVSLSEGAVIEPAVLNLEILDNDIPQIIINEIHVNPTENTGQFIEFVNSETNKVDISGWRVSDDSGLRHVFPDGTILPASGALVLFEKDQIGSEDRMGQALVQGTNNSESLSLNTSGDTVTLQDIQGNSVASVTYGAEARESSSLTRDPDVTGPFVNHELADKSGGELYSPGTKSDGTPFDTEHAIAIKGEESWRLISSPTTNTSFNDLLGSLWVQGIPGSDAPSSASTVYRWDEAAGRFSVPSNISETMETGKGFLVYVFEDEDLISPGIQGGFPKVLDAGKTAVGNSVGVEVSSTDRNEDLILGGDEGWNLLANPFDTKISVEKVLDLLQNADPNFDVNLNIQVWDHTAGNGNGAFISLAEGETIAPYQPFWVRFDSVGLNTTLKFDKNALAATRNRSFYSERSIPSINLRLGDGTQYDQYRIELRDEAAAGTDRYDAFKLHSLNSKAISLFSLAENNTRLSKNVVPREMDRAVEIPLAIDVPRAGSYIFTWDGLSSIPDSWNITLTDRENGTEIDLRVDKEFSFRVAGIQNEEGNESSPVLNSANYRDNDEEPRFVLSLNPDGAGDESNQVPETVKLNPNYPNPFNPATTIPYELKEETRVKLTIWNIVGQKVGTLVDGMVEAGEHEVSWNASDMPSGIYIIQLEVGGRVYTRKITLIK